MTNRSIFENSPIGIELYDRDGRLVDANRACLEIFGARDREDVLGFDLFKDPNLSQDHKSRLRGGESVMYTAPFDFRKVKDNNLYPTGKTGVMELQVLITPLLSDGTREIDGYLVQVQDITPIKNVERELQREKDRLAWVLEGTNVGTWEWNVQTGETVFNERWAEFIGYTLDELSPVSIQTWTSYANPEDLEKSSALLEEHFRGDKDYYHCECRMKHRDGRWIWVLDRGKVATWTDDGRPEWMFGTHQVITEQKEAEEEIKRQLSEKENLLREVHHRIRNNLSSIASLLSMHRNSSGNDEVKSALSDAVSRVQSIRVLYDKLLLDKNITVISMKSYLEGILDSLGELFPEGKKVTIERRIDDFVIDSKRAVSLGIIMNELMTNAFKYAFCEREKGQISISLVKNNGKVSLSIADDGVGMNVNNDAGSGRGLGLTIVHILVKQLKGTYDVFTEDGTKSTIQFEI